IRCKYLILIILLTFVRLCDNVAVNMTTDIEIDEKPGGGALIANKNAETHGHYKRKLKLDAVSFDDLNFSSSGGEQLPKRFIELLNHCGGEHLVSAVRRRIIERVVFTTVMRAPHSSKFNC